MGLDGPFGEHIRLALQLSVLITDFQRTEQVIGRIVCIGQTVCTCLLYTSFLLCSSLLLTEAIQLCLCRLQTLGHLGEGIVDTGKILSLIHILSRRLWTE